MALYLENFLNFPVGMNVPVGFYDRGRGVWVPEESGRVVQIVAITAGRAYLDVNGDGTRSRSRGRTTTRPEDRLNCHTTTVVIQRRPGHPRSAVA